MEDSERLSGEALLFLVWEQVVWWWTITIARSISRPGLRDLLRDLLLLTVFWWLEFPHLSLLCPLLSLLPLLLAVSSPSQVLPAREGRGTWS